MALFHDELTNHNKIGDRICLLRKENKLTQEDLAEKLGVTRQTIWKWEVGITFPDANKINTLCKIFKIEADYFFKDSIDQKEEDSELQVKLEEKINRKGLPIIRIMGWGCFIFLLLLFITGSIVSGIILLSPRKSSSVENVTATKFFLPIELIFTVSLSSIAILVTIFFVIKFKRK